MNVDDLYRKWYNILIDRHARDILDSKCSLELAAKKVFYKTGFGDIYSAESDLIEKVKELGYISQKDFI